MRGHAGVGGGVCEANGGEWERMGWGKWTGGGGGGWLQPPPHPLHTYIPKTAWQLLLGAISFSSSCLGGGRLGPSARCLCLFHSGRAAHCAWTLSPPIPLGVASATGGARGPHVWAARSLAKRGEWVDWRRRAARGAPGGLPSRHVCGSTLAAPRPQPPGERGGGVNERPLVGCRPCVGFPPSMGDASATQPGGECRGTCPLCHAGMPIGMPRSRLPPRSPVWARTRSAAGATSGPRTRNHPKSRATARPLGAASRGAPRGDVAACHATHVAAAACYRQSVGPTPRRAHPYSTSGGNRSPRQHRPLRRRRSHDAAAHKTPPPPKPSPPIPTRVSLPSIKTLLSLSSPSLPPSA